MSRAIKSGMNQFLSKPIPVSILKSIIHYLGYEIQEDQIIQKDEAQIQNEKNQEFRRSDTRMVKQMENDIDLMYEG